MTASVRFVFPEEEPEIYTRMSFFKYERPTPRSRAEISLEDVVRLPLPTELSDAFNVKLNSTDLDLTESIFGNRVDGQGFVDDFLGAVSTGQQQSFWNRFKSATSGMTALMPGFSDTNIGRLNQSRQGIVRNPHTTTIFEGVNIRSHNFTFKLSPKSKNEGESLLGIVELIKARMLPEVEFGGFALNYPYLVKLDFVGARNVTRVERSFISGFQPNFSASGFAAFFNDGTPIDVTLTLGLQELDILTREDIEGRTRDQSNLSEGAEVFGFAEPRSFNGGENMG